MLPSTSEAVQNQVDPLEMLSPYMGKNPNRIPLSDYFSVSALSCQFCEPPSLRLGGTSNSELVKVVEFQHERAF